MAGLAAAMRLTQTGHELTVLKAQNRERAEYVPSLSATATLLINHRCG